MRQENLMKTLIKNNLSENLEFHEINRNKIK